MGNNNSRLCFVSTPEGSVDLGSGVEGVELSTPLRTQVAMEFWEAQRRGINTEGIQHDVAIKDVLYSGNPQEKYK